MIRTRSLRSPALRITVVTATLGAALVWPTRTHAVPSDRLPREDGVPHYVPELRGLTGTLNSVGSDTMDVVVFGWIQLFRKFHPNVRMTMEARSSLTACPALISGAADIGPMARTPPYGDVVAFEKKFGYKPLLIRVGGGSYEKDNHSPTIAVYVNRSNPLERITLAQLDAIYSASPRHGGQAAITTWSQLGLTGVWANRPVVAYAARRPNGIADAFQDRVLLAGPFKPTIHERANSPTERVLDSVVAAVAEDADGIGYAGFAHATSAVKALAVAETEAEPYVAGTLASVTDKSYPLARYVYIAINKAPGKPLPPGVREFLRLVLSREGQQVIADEGFFLPLPAAIVREELARLD